MSPVRFWVLPPFFVYTPVQVTGFFVFRPKLRAQNASRTPSWRSDTLQNRQICSTAQIFWKRPVSPPILGTGRKLLIISNVILCHSGHYKNNMNGAADEIQTCVLSPSVNFVRCRSCENTFCGILAINKQPNENVITNRTRHKTNPEREENI